MKRRLAWITGAGGLIGSHLARAAATGAPDWEVRALERGQLELTDFNAVRQRFAQDKPDLILHCAALTKTPVCQAEPARARLINVDVTRILAELADEIPFLFFSTDLVFDGAKGNYTETDRPNPLNIYAETKVAAEEIVLANPRHTVIRTSLNGGISPTGDRGFNEEMRRAWAEGQELRLFVDEFRSPIPASVTARAIWEFVRRPRPGIFHLAGCERLSRWQIGELIAARWPHLKPRLVPISLREYRGAPRAPDTTLNCGKIQALLPFALPAFSEWLGLHAEEPI